MDGYPNEDSFRAHQVPLAISATTPPEHLAQLETWLGSYRPDVTLRRARAAPARISQPRPDRSPAYGCEPYANGGLLLHDLRMPDFRDYAVAVPAPGAVRASDTGVTGQFLRDVIRLNQTPRTFLVFGPDETLSSKLNAVFEVTNRQWLGETAENDEFLAQSGGVLKMLSAFTRLVEQAKNLIADVPQPNRPALLIRLDRVGRLEITLRAVEAKMAFDKTSLVVPAGKPV